MRVEEGEEEEGGGRFRVGGGGDEEEEDSVALEPGERRLQRISKGKAISNNKVAITARKRSCYLDTRTCS